jgi:hypothetical protein
MRCAFIWPDPLQSLRVLAEDAQLETKRSYEGATRADLASEWVRK